MPRKSKSNSQIASAIEGLGDPFSLDQLAPGAVGLLSATGVTFLAAQAQSAAEFLENVDEFLKIELFTTIAGIALTFAALLLPAAVQKSGELRDVIKNPNAAGIAPTQAIVALKLGQAVRAAMSSFVIGIVGIIVCIFGDGFFEHRFNLGDREEPRHIDLIDYLHGPGLRDFLEDFSGSFVLAFSIGLILLAAQRAMVSLIDSVIVRP